MSAFGGRVQPIDATPSNLARWGGVRWKGMHGHGLRRSRELSFGSAGSVVNVWRISPERLRGGTRAASPQGGGAVYTCPSGGSGAYAQCDGGACFRSTEETTFPGFDKPVPKGTNHLFLPHHSGDWRRRARYQILGPYPCDKSFFQYCKGDSANSKTGSTIYVGAAQALAVLLNGEVPPVNECHE